MGSPLLPPYTVSPPSAALTANLLMRFIWATPKNQGDCAEEAYILIDVDHDGFVVGGSVRRMDGEVWEKENLPIFHAYSIFRHRAQASCFLQENTSTVTKHLELLIALDSLG